MDGREIDIMQYLIPGLYQLGHKQYKEGLFLILIFLIVFLTGLKMFLFHNFGSLWMPYWMGIAGTFFIILLWHLLSVIHMNTALPSSKKETPELLYEKGRMACLKSQFELAEIYFEKLLAQKPGDEDVLYQLGRTYIELKKSDKAKSLFKQYLSGKGSKWRHEIEDLLEEHLKS